jgi:hypothetical protein
MHFQVRFVDKRLVAGRALDFSFGLVIADSVELQRSLCLEELITGQALEGFFGAVSVLWREKSVKIWLNLSSATSIIDKNRSLHSKHFQFFPKSERSAFQSIKLHKITHQMLLKVRRHRKAAVANVTLERFLASVRPVVQDELVTILERLRARRAEERLFVVRMRFLKMFTRICL